MKKYTTDQLREIVKKLPDDAKIPREYAAVFNKYHTTDNPGGRAYINWFLDYIDGKPSIALPPEEVFPYKIIDSSDINS